jgi:SulP family sulfate permease
MRALPDVPSSKVIRALRKWATDLEAHGGRMLIAGVSPAAAKVLARGGIDDLLGPDGIVPATNRVFGALDEALDRGRRWISERIDGDSDTRD